MDIKTVNATLGREHKNGRYVQRLEVVKRAAEAYLEDDSDENWLRLQSALAEANQPAL